MPDGDDSTQSRLLDAAETLFGERGFDGVGIREIADSAGVNLSGIKYHFGSKHGLYLETMRRAMDRQGSTAAWALLEGPSGSPEEAARALRAFVGAFLRVLLGGEECGSSVCLVMQSSLHPGESTDLVVREFIRPHHERLCALIGVLRPDVSASERAQSAQSVMALMLHRRVFRPLLDRLGEGVALGDGAGSIGERELERLADEVSVFALRGMGCGTLAAAALSEGVNAGMDGEPEGANG